MADTNRNINKIQDASQSSAWERKENPAQKKGNMKASGDTKPNKKAKTPARSNGGKGFNGK